jgi:hypothetical protein
MERLTIGSLRGLQAVSSIGRRATGRVFMRYKVKSIAALQLALGGLPKEMRVEVDADVAVSEKTVSELRQVAAWPDNLAISTPQDHHAGSVVTVSRANTSTRISPKA